MRNHRRRRKYKGRIRSVVEGTSPASNGDNTNFQGTRAITRTCSSVIPRTRSSTTSRAPSRNASYVKRTTTSLTTKTEPQHTTRTTRTSSKTSASRTTTRTESRVTTHGSRTTTYKNVYYEKFKPKAGIISIENFKCIFCFQLPKLPEDANRGIVLCPHCGHPAHADEFKDWLKYSPLCSRCNVPIPKSYRQKPVILPTRLYMKIIKAFIEKRRYETKKSIMR